MEQTPVVRWFLGGNTKDGFYSLYEDYTDPAVCGFLYVIKGGPGCGKSTLMKRVGAAAEAAGLPVEYVHCSGDPDSLDAVRLPSRGLAWVDGTAPHVIEARLPGAASVYLDMSRFLDASALRPLLPALAETERRYKALYALAYRQLAAGAALLPKNLPGLDDGARPGAIKRAKSLARRLLPARGGTGTVTRRFCSAVCCRGRLSFPVDTEAYPLRYCPDNALGLGHVYLDALKTEALERGYDLILCPDPLEPEKPEALLVPEAGLAAAVPEAGLGGRRIRLDALADPERLSERRELLRERKRESAALLRAGTETLAQAKALHDELEGLYRGHVDFAGADALAEEMIALALG